jgi:hypothetical protein
MKSFFTPSRRSFLLAAIPAVLAFSSCGNDDDDTPATPSQGKALFSHAAPTASASVKVLANDKDLGALNYGITGSYLTLDAGAQTIKINDATSNVTAVTQTVTIEKDKNYSVFAYSPTATLGSVTTLAITDDLTAPTTGKAKIRLVHLGVGAPSQVSLSQPGAVGTTDIIPNVSFASGSPFVEITPGTYALAISTGTGATATIETSVGDGTGIGTGTKAYVAGKIYTVVVRGIKSTTTAPELRLKAVLVENN